MGGDSISRRPHEAPTRRLHYEIGPLEPGIRRLLLFWSARGFGHPLNTSPLQRLKYTLVSTTSGACVHHTRRVYKNITRTPSPQHAKALVRSETITIIANKGIQHHKNSNAQSARRARVRSPRSRVPARANRGAHAQESSVPH